MARLWILIGLAAFMMARSAAVHAEGDATAGLPRWMSGCWLTDPGQTTRVEECWTMPRGSMMLGSSQTYDSEGTRSFEHMRILRDAEGLGFIGQPGGTTSVRFKLDRQSAGEVSFVNATHDYPQRITYRLADGKLVAEIALLDGSKPTRWTYRRD
ncbi:DUF6265 family protein [Sphingobium nicotianae]|uniref:DUF6265 domain-containing protein n=1 Tax=Sphingobium nicotianae TaxID=2782607 RepID=A0A9X1DD56_9SPHN|nr:DUF6265 family protein [Sphingobium nicotianae]MBT2187990.1 hypothetical protein [Sphingobium nicotianae]